MFVFLVILTVVIFLALLLVTAMRPVSSSFSISELERRAKHSAVANTELHRQKMLPYTLTLLRMKQAVLLTLFAMLAVVAYGWAIGVILAIVVALFYQTIARTKLVQLFADKLLAVAEPVIVTFVTRFESIFHAIVDTPLYKGSRSAQFGSREELQELISASKDALTNDERLMISSALAFKDKKIASIMTPRSMIKYIERSEFLGPLVLDELHGYGHSRLPVINGDLNHIVGILYLRDLLSLDTKHSTTAEKAMESKVFYINQNDSLHRALAAFLKNRHHLFVVLNDERETVGLVSLEDVMEQLLGKKIVDEDDVYEDLRVAARHEGAANNTPEGRVDL